MFFEIGAYIGYSATLLGSKLADDGQLITLETSAENADIARQVVNHAGLSEKEVVVEGILSDHIEGLKQMLKARGGDKFDFVFIDHNGSRYLSDFLIWKDQGLIGKGTVVFADIMIRPGAPEYREYINQHTAEYSTQEHVSGNSFLGHKDSVFVTNCA